MLQLNKNCVALAAVLLPFLVAGRTAEADNIAVDRVGIASAVATVVDLAVVARAEIAAEVDTVPNFCVGAAMVEVGRVLNSLLTSFPNLRPMHLNR